MNNEKKLALEIRRLAVHLRHMERTIDAYMGLLNQLGDVVRQEDRVVSGALSVADALTMLCLNNNIDLSDDLLNAPPGLREQHNKLVGIMNQIMQIANNAKQENQRLAHLNSSKFISLPTPADQMRHVQEIVLLLNELAPVPEPEDEPPPEEPKDRGKVIVPFPKTPPTKH